MKKYRSTYNLIVLLIAVSAFPVSISAMTDLNQSDSLICKFHETQNNNGNTIECDHCTYYFDVAPSLSEKNIYAVGLSTFLKVSAREKPPASSYILVSSRSPPIS